MPLYTEEEMSAAITDALMGCASPSYHGTLRRMSPADTKRYGDYLLHEREHKKRSDLKRIREFVAVFKAMALMTRGFCPAAIEQAVADAEMEREAYRDGGSEFSERLAADLMIIKSLFVYSDDYAIHLASEQGK
ncbi:hypothetical protein CNY89_01985 [Amaricoccus sp. HAR-UPW-R2A-40]|nr:hypothetical protein CNY89_01985 [Amaricoccus sp. HAR-UPW-R2A-40]